MICCMKKNGQSDKDSGMPTVLTRAVLKTCRPDRRNALAEDFCLVQTSRSRKWNALRYQVPEGSGFIRMQWYWCNDPCIKIQWRSFEGWMIRMKNLEALKKRNSTSGINILVQPSEYRCELVVPLKHLFSDRGRNRFM